MHTHTYVHAYIRITYMHTYTHRHTYVRMYVHTFRTILFAMKARWLSFCTILCEIVQHDSLCTMCNRSAPFCTSFRTILCARWKVHHSPLFIPTHRSDIRAYIWMCTRVCVCVQRRPARRAGLVFVCPPTASAAYFSALLTIFTSQLKPHASSFNVCSLKT